MLSAPAHFQATHTDLTANTVEIERMHRGRANAEDRMRAAKQTGLDTSSSLSSTSTPSGWRFR